ncbi:hypothetical protein X744_29680 [Mesorhizobium sp. LNJC372A00]|nr:hypothetical protein X745_30845 [Mesorhizobium sp. LNJC374B00]ESY52281.1 hypothetical protein X744_29680 [Mesorhizobium sp. LNJC372A00]
MRHRSRCHAATVAARRIGSGEALIRALLAVKRGEPRVCAMVRVPTPENEARRRTNRERNVMVAERVEHAQPMGWTPPKGIAMCQGSGVETLLRQVSMNHTIIIAVDLAKNVFQLHGMRADGSVAFLRRYRGPSSSRSWLNIRPVLSRWKPAPARITGDGRSGNLAMRCA